SNPGCARTTYVLFLLSSYSPLGSAPRSDQVNWLRNSAQANSASAVLLFCPNYKASFLRLYASGSNELNTVALHQINNTGFRLPQADFLLLCISGIACVTPTLIHGKH